jgi:AMP-binding enzyme
VSLHPVVPTNLRSDASFSLCAARRTPDNLHTPLSIVAMSGVDSALTERWIDLLDSREGGVSIRGKVASWREIASEASARRAGFSAVYVRDNEHLALDAVVAIVAGLRQGGDVCLAPLPGGGLEVGYNRASRRGEGRLTVFSSGTTGAPKPVFWRWPDLVQAPAPSVTAPCDMWCGYAIDSFAGIQALVAALRSARFLYIGRDLPHPKATLGLAMAAPTQWRRLLAVGLLSNPHCLKIDIASMGGEPADQLLLDTLRALRPTVRVTHVYAATEFGPVFSVSDGRAGFPATYLERSLTSGVRLSIDAGELLVWRSGALHRTGDLVERDGDRVHFRGRVGQLALVAGRSVSLYWIETVLRAVHGVVDVKAHAVPNALTGAVIVADVVAARSADPKDVEARMRAHAAALLRREEAPRRYSFTAEIVATRSGKAVGALAGQSEGVQ